MGFHQKQVSITRDPLSNELTKNVTINITPTTDKRVENGKYSKNLNKAIATLLFTASANSGAPQQEPYLKQSYPLLSSTRK